MFVDVDSAPSPSPNSLPNVRNGQSIREGIYYVMTAIILSLMVLSFILNFFLAIVLTQKTLKDHCCSFYKITLTSAVTIVISSAIDIFCTIYIELMRHDHKIVNEVTLLASLIATYFITTLVFMLGVNRFAAFCSPRLNESVMKTRKLTVLLLVLFVFSAIVGTAIFKLSGFQKCYYNDDDRVMNEAQNGALLTVFNYVFYTIPLSSTVFYLLCFLSLRSKRALVRTEKTMELLDNAERDTLKQGISILLFYLGSLAIHCVLSFYPPQYASYFILSYVEVAFSTLPQLAIPLAALAYCKEIRGASKRLLLCRMDTSAPKSAADSAHRSRSIYSKTPRSMKTTST